MSLSRFHLPESEWSAPELRLAGGEAAHCAQVLRKQEGDRIEVFDGQGRSAECTLTRVSRSTVEARIEKVTRFQPLEPRIHLLAAVIKGERMDWLLEKAVELGAASVHPMLTENSVVKLNGESASKKAGKWHQTMIAAAKQCHIPFLPELHPAVSFASAIEAVPETAIHLIAALDEHHRTIDDVMGKATAEDVVIAIGPEGDFSGAELRLASERHFQPVTLGPLILRAETAAVTALARLTRHRRILQETPGA